MKKRLLAGIILMTAVMLKILASQEYLNTQWGDELKEGCRESLNTGTYTPSRSAFDKNEETYWAIKGGEEFGWIEKYWEGPKDIEKILINVELEEGATLKFYYEKDGTWIEYENGRICGPIKGIEELYLTEKTKKTEHILIELSGDIKGKSKIYEVEFVERTNCIKFGKIKPESYTFNQEEYINIKPDRLWNGYINETWYEPLWYIPWEIQQTPEGQVNSGIFAPYNGNPVKEGEIIWELGGEYSIEMIKAYFGAGWRNIAFDFWDGNNWNNRKEFRNTIQNGWNKIELQKPIRTERIRITFPSGWEYARFINQIEIWGKGEVKNKEYSIPLVYDKTNSRWKTTVTEIGTKNVEAEISVKGKTERKIKFIINGITYILEKPYLITKENSYYKIKINADDIRLGEQYLEIDADGLSVEEMLIQEIDDRGIIPLEGVYTDGYTKHQDEIAEQERIVNFDRKYQIEKIRIYKESDGEIGVYKDALNWNLVKLEYNREGYWEADLDGIEKDSLKIRTDINEKINEIEIYGSPIEDKGVSVEIWNRKKEITGKSCIVGWTGSSETSAVIDENNYPRREGHIFWIPVNACNREYMSKCEHAVEAKLGEKSTTLKYKNYVEEDTFKYIENLKNTQPALAVDFPYGDMLTQKRVLPVSGRVANGNKIRIYINGVEAENWNGIFVSEVELSEGENSITVIAEDERGRKTEKRITVIKDSEIPIITIQTPKEGEYIKNHSVTFTVDGSPDEELWWKFNNEEWEKGNGNVKVKTYYHDDGYYSYSIKASDRAGNISNIEKINFCIDTTPPENLNIEIEEKGWTNNNIPKVEFSAEDATSGIACYEYRIDDGNWNICKSPLQLEVLEDGVRELSIRAIDNAGNEKLEKKTFYIDTSVPPKPVNDRPVSAENSIIFKWEGLDDGEEFRSYKIERKPAWKNGPKYIENIGYGTIEYKDEETEIGKEYSYRIWSIDRAGNESQKTEWKNAISGIAITDIEKNKNTVIEYDGMTVILPKNSMAEDIIRIQINKIPDEYLEKKPKNTVLSSTYMTTVVRKNGDEEIITNHANLLESAIVEINYNPNLLPEGYANSEIAAFYYDDIWGCWMQMKNCYINTEKHTLLFKTNHFTDFNIQATKKAILTEAELRESSYKLSSEDVGPEEVRVSGEEGGVSLRFTELKLPGKNGLDFAIERVYSTGQAYSDACETQKEKSDKKEIDIDGESEWKIANGWKMNVPSLKINGSTIVVNGLNGCSSSIGQMSKVEEVSSKDNNDYQIIMENHEYIDFRVRFEFKKEKKERKFLWFSREYNIYSLKGATLYQNDGKILYFDECGRINSIKDCTELNTITFTYGENNTITDSLGNVVEFIKKDGYITEIKQGLKTITYMKSDQNNLMNVTDVAGRKWEYDYTKITLTNSSELLNSPSGYTQSEPKSYDIYAISKISGKQIGYTKITYDTKKLSYEDSVDSYNYLISSMKLFATKKEEGLKEDNILRTTEYKLSFNDLAVEKQFFVTKSVVNNGLIKVETVYDKVIKNRLRLSNAPEAIKNVTGYKDSINTQQEEEKQVLTYAKTIKTYEVDGFLISTEKNTIENSTMRIKEQKLIKGINNSVINEYVYLEKNQESETPENEKFITGNIVKETHTYKTGTHESRTQITRTYSDPINNRLNLVKTITTLSEAKENNNSISNTSVTESYDYNDFGQMITRTTFKGDYTYTYKEGLLFSVTTPEGKETQYEYDYELPDLSNYQIETIRKQKSSDLVDSKISETSIYDKVSGKEVKYIDPDNYVTIYEYDALGRLKKQEKQDTDNNKKSTVLITYDDKNNKTVVTDELGAITTNQYDELGRLVSISKEDPSKKKENTITSILNYDIYDRVIAMSEPIYDYDEDKKLDFNEFSYDNQSRIKKEIDSDKYETVYEYDDNTNVTVKITGKENLIKERITKDNLGNVLKTEKWIEKDLWISNEIYYDGEGRVVKQIDGKNQITSQDYDELGLLKSITYPNNLIESRKYNNDGVLIEISKEYDDMILSQEIYELDDFNRIKTKSIPVTLDKKEKNQNVVESFTYDGRGNIKTKSIFYEGQKDDTKEVSFEYDYLGNIKVQTDGMGYETKYEYDVAGNLTKIEDPRNSESYKSEFFVQMEYDGFGRLIKGWTPNDVKRTELNEDNVNVIFEYNAQGDIKKRTETEEAETVKIETVYSYSSKGRLKEVEIDGNKTKYIYNDAGLLYKQINPDNVVTFNYYDGTGRLIKQCIGESTNKGIQYSYDNNGNVKEIIDRNGNRTSYTYNELNLVTKENINNLISMDYEYDMLGRKISETDGEKNNRTYTYDMLNRITKEETPEGYTLIYQYDARGNVILYKDSKGTKFYRTYTKNDQLASENVYDNDLAKIISKRNYSYDEGGMLKEINYDSESIKYNTNNGIYQSNAYGNISSMLWSSTKLEMKYTYDVLNRLTSVTTPDGKTNTYTYNQNSQITSMTNFIEGKIEYLNSKILSYTTKSDIKKEFVYDTENGLITKVSYNSSAQKGNISKYIQYSYDNNYNIKTRNVSGLEDIFNYDGANRITQSNINGKIQSKDWMKPENYELYEIERDLNHQKNIADGECVNSDSELILDSMGKSFVYSFNSNKTINKIELYPKTEKHRICKDNISIYIKKNKNDSWEEVLKSDWKFAIDMTNGSIHIEFKTAIEASSLKIHNDWDDRDFYNISHNNYATFKNDNERMIRIWTLEDNVKESYQYDGNSNRVDCDISYYKNNLGGNTPMVKYDGKWYYTYDENGNRTAKGKKLTANGNAYIQKTDSSLGKREENVTINMLYEYWTYEWDLYNRLIKVKQYNSPDKDSCVEVTYEYDALNFRTKRTSVLEGTVTEYAYGRNGTLTYEKFTDKDNNVYSRTYAYLNDQIIGFTDTVGDTSSKRYVITDIQGSVNEIYDEDGNLIWKSGYTTFGELSGESVDKLEGGFEFHGMYTGCQIDGETGLTYHWNRWRSEDGSQFITPDPARDGGNWYGYAGQNPLIYVDPTGLSTTLDDFNYNNRTNDPDKSAENQQRYNGQEKEYARQNQGLSEYGKIVETYQEFADTIFTKDKLLNQNTLDLVLGYKKKIGKSQSCLISSMINAYACLFRKGITGLQIMDALFDGDGNIMDFIGEEKKSNGAYSFYCKNLWNLSYALANSMDAKKKDFIESQDINDTSRVFLRPDEKKYDPVYGNFFSFEFQKMINMSIQCTNEMGKYCIRGLVKYTDCMKINTFQSGHYVFSMNSQILDSLNPYRDGVDKYIPNSYYKLTLDNRY